MNLLLQWNANHPSTEKQTINNPQMSKGTATRKIIGGDTAPLGPAVQSTNRGGWPVAWVKSFWASAACGTHTFGSELTKTKTMMKF